jgi:(4S)-4-hydroxy-5-phosphonooxypentane-2,3-dione isomerase
MPAAASGFGPWRVSAAHCECRRDNDVLGGTRMTAVAIVVDFRLKPGTRAQFRKLIDVNARMSAQTELGCQRFDVVEPRDQPDRLFLYELYDDDAAFEEHKTTAHYIHFNAESAALVMEKTVIRCDLVCEGSSRTGNQD